VSDVMVLNQSSLFPEICYTFQTVFGSGQRRTDFFEGLVAISTTNQPIWF